MPRAIVPRSLVSRAVTARSNLSAFRLPYSLIDMGLTHIYDFRTGFLGANSRAVKDLRNKLDISWRGGTALSSVYTAGEYQADLERSSNDYFSSNAYSYGSMSALTYFAWIKRESTGAIHHILADWETAGNQRGSRLYLTGDVFELSLSTNGTANTSYTSTESLLDTGSFHFIVVTYDTSNRCTMTLDGVDLTVSLTAGSHPATINSSGVPKMIGANLPATPANFFDGIIGICGVFAGKALSSAEKATLRTLTNAVGAYV